MGKIAAVFSGQGAQYPGMGKSLYESSAAAKKVLDGAEALRPGTLAQCFLGTKDELALTVNTQPCLCAVNNAAGAALQEAGIRIDGAAGFSLGELSAAAFCGVFTYADAFSLSVSRGALMHRFAEKTKGGMAAVLKLSADSVEAVCARIGGVYPANYNSAEQTVISGESEAVDKAVAEIAAKGGRAVKLSVSGAFHTPFMKEAAAAFRADLDAVAMSAPKLPLYANVTAAPYAGCAAELLERQISSPVRWVQTVLAMKADGFDTFIEAGAGSTLSGLIKRIIPEARVFSTENLSSWT